MKFWNAVLVLLLSVGAVFAETEPQKVTFTTEDGLKLSGTYYPGGPNAVVLSAQDRTSQFSWQDVAVELADQGYSVLTYDYRGFGESEGEYSVTRAVADVTAAYQWMQSRGAKAIALVGASLGASLTYKSALPVKAAVLVSPGYTIDDPTVPGPHGPLLFITSSYDFARKDTETLFAAAAQPKQLFIARGQDHGNGIVDGDDRVRPLIYDFLKKSFR